MLGWEFPPVINGGLGIACHDLCIALSEYARVTMIIPKSNPDFIVKNLELLGLNNIDANSLKQVTHQYDSKTFEDVHFIPANINPYYTEFADLRSSKYIKNVRLNESGEEVDVFDIDDLYGGDVIEKVTLFGKLAARVALTREFDVIHAHDWMTMLAGMEIKRVTGKPLVVHIHSLEIDRGGVHSRGWVYDTEKRGMEYADLLMPVSNFTGDIIHKYYGISYDKIATVHNGIRPVNAFRTKKPFDESMVLFVGRLTRQKGPEFFVEIASKVLEYCPDVRFVMAGTGEGFKSLIDRSSYKHIGTRFHLTGFLNLEKVRRLLSMTDVYCMPSVSEPFGLSAVEAVQFGVPCVISKQSGVSEVLRGSLKFDFWDTNRAADYIINLIGNKVLKDKVVSDAYDDLQHISWDFSARKVIEHYHQHKIFLN